MAKLQMWVLGASDEQKYGMRRIYWLDHGIGRHLPEFLDLARDELVPLLSGAVIDIDLNGAFYCTQAVLPAMRAQRDGLIINISSWAGVWVSYVPGPAYTAAKHAMNAMTESLNLEECVNGIRACAICPGDVSTPIMDKRPVPMSTEDRARMVQPEDLGEAILFVAAMPAHVCINELIISPTWNSSYLRYHQTVAPK